MDNKEPRQILPPEEETQNSDIDALITAEHYKTGQFNSYDYNESLFDRVTSALADNKLLLVPLVAVPVLLIGLALGVNGTNSNENANEETISLADFEQTSDDSMVPVSINSVGDEEGNETDSTSSTSQSGTTAAPTPTTTSNATNSSGSNSSQGQGNPNHDSELDVCRNLFGVQTTVPSHLTRDSRGNCVAPPSQDVCPNLLGLQLAVPAGKTKDSVGNCIDIVQDLCSNIDGLQAQVPADYVRNSAGKCNKDLCNNIDGNQAILPANYVRNAKGACHKDLCNNITGNQATVPPNYVRNSAGKCILAPANKIDLRPWKLTLPVGRKEDPEEIKGQDLSKIVRSPWFIPTKKNNQLTQVEFYVDSKRATATTSGSDNPRSELRDMTYGDKKGVGFSSSSGTHQLLTRLKVTTNTGTDSGGKNFAVVISQIHDAADDVTVFRLERTKLWATNGDEPHWKLIDGNVKLNQVITVGFKTTGGKIHYYYSKTGAKNPPIVATMNRSFKGGYFKAGNYCQCGSPRTGQTRVVILGLGLNHNGGLPDIGGK